MKWAIGLSNITSGHYVVITEEEWQARRPKDSKYPAHEAYMQRTHPTFETRKEAEAWIEEQKEKSRIALEMGYGTGRYQGD